MKAASPSAWLGLALACAVALAWLGFVLAPSHPARDAAALRPPALPAPRRACDAQPALRLRRATEVEAAAEAKIARYRYAPAEGIAALALLSLAEHCYAAAPAEADRARLAVRAAAWRAHLERDYQAQLIRRERALALGDARAASAATTFLLELLQGERGAFVAQLRRAQFEIEARAMEETR